jgi:nitric oxide reductase subunit B
MQLMDWSAMQRVGCRVRATILFLGSGMLGIAHNFYSNAKPVATSYRLGLLHVAGGAVADAHARSWRLRQQPAAMEGKGRSIITTLRPFRGLPFLTGVSFWNFRRRLGLIINLPLVNYTRAWHVPDGQSRPRGVHGRLREPVARACSSTVSRSTGGVVRALRRAFCAINVGLMLMVVLDLFPVGVLQLQAVLEHGLAWARSDAFIQSREFRSLTWMRSIGVVWFIAGGVLPIAWFLVTRLTKLRTTAPVPLPPPVAETHAPLPV